MNNGKTTKNPVVVVLGHIDHGKSSLLEAIRKDIRITAKESGGITQHIGAYEIEHNGKGITFIDTPGHEAFSAMRLRGAKVADIAVLVVDASEGIKDQTKEAIKAVKEANIPMIVALNKIDKPQSQPEWVQGELQKQGVVVEPLGGDIPVVKTSATTGQGIEDLLETIILLAEMEKLEADYSLSAQGVVIESSKSPQEGPIASLILSQGILKVGDIIGTSSCIGKVKRIINCWGKPLKEAKAGQPVQVLGFEQTPETGEIVKVFPDIETAKQNLRQQEQKTDIRRVDQDKRILNLIIKADVQGSLEAIKDTLMAIPQEEVLIEIIKSSVGNINSSDIQLAENSKAKIFGFKVKIDDKTKGFARHMKVFPKTFDVIYEMVEEVRKEVEKMLKPEKKRIDLAKVKVLVIFKKDKKGQIIGGRVIDGVMTSNVLAEVIRNEEIIGQGRIKNIQQEKKNIVSATKGKEIGMFFIGEADIQENDILHIFKEEESKKTLKL